MAIEPASRELVVHKAPQDVHAALLSYVADLDGDVETAAETYIEAEFGSRGKTLLKGSAFADSDDLPRKLEAYLSSEGDATRLKLLVRPTQRIGTWGAEGKYEQALASFADRVVSHLVAS